MFKFLLRVRGGIEINVRVRDLLCDRFYEIFRNGRFLEVESRLVVFEVGGGEKGEGLLTGMGFFLGL